MPNACIDVYSSKQITLSSSTQCIIEGHEEIDTTKVVPENSKVLDFLLLLLLLVLLLNAGNTTVCDSPVRFDTAFSYALTIAQLSDLDGKTQQNVEKVMVCPSHTMRRAHATSAHIYVCMCLHAV